jgi:Raf kinase inhibitor-like YbhB/YbcL family protein
VAEDATGVIQVSRALRHIMHACPRAAIACALFPVLAGSALAQNPPARPPAQPGAQPPTPAGRGGGGGAGRGGIRVMTLTSPAFADGAMIPAKHAQVGHDVSPPLTWTGAPDSTRSFVLIVHDVDAAIGDGSDDMLHWLVWNIPGTATSLPEGVPQGTLTMTGAATGNNAPRQLSGTGPYYRGPAAPASGPPHHYLFELYALDINVPVAATQQTAPPVRAAVMSTILSHIRGKAVLVGLYRRPVP